MQVCNRGALRLAIGARVPGRSEPVPLVELQPGGRAWLPVLRPEPGLLSFRPAKGTVHNLRKTLGFSVKSQKLIHLAAGCTTRAVCACPGRLTLVTNGRQSMWACEPDADAG